VTSDPVTSDPVTSDPVTSDPATSDRLAWILNSDQADQTALQARYDEWALSYDDDHDDWGWIGPDMVTAAVLESLPENARTDNAVTVYDAGCGTGRAGVALRAAGWAGPIVGLDLSAGMLAVAARSGAYSELIKCSLYDVPIASDTAGALVSCGVFTQGHVTSRAFGELARITRPSGVVAITIRTDLEDQFSAEADRLSSTGAWQQLDRSSPTSSHPTKNTTEQVVLRWRC